MTTATLSWSRPGLPAPYTATATIDGWASDHRDFATFLDTAFPVGGGGESAGDPVLSAVSRADAYLNPGGTTANTFNPSQPRGEDGKWVHGQSVHLPGSVRESLLKEGRIGPLAGKLESTLEAHGVGRPEIEQMKSLFDGHRHGEGSQEHADAEIAKHFNDPGSKLGHALRTQSAIEEAIRQEYEATRGERLAADREKSMRGTERDWKEGLGNKFAYDSWREEWDAEHAYKFEDPGPTRYYRKGGLDKDVVPTSMNKTGAQAYSVTGATQPHYEPNASWTAEEMHAAGYRVLGGFGFINMGYSGEDEITWIKAK